MRVSGTSLPTAYSSVGSTSRKYPTDLNAIKDYLDNRLQNCDLLPPTEAYESTQSPTEAYPLAQSRVVTDFYQDFLKQPVDQYKDFFKNLLKLHDGALYDAHDIKNDNIKEKRMLLIHGILQRDAIFEFKILNKIVEPNIDGNEELKQLINDLQPLRICNPCNLPKNPQEMCKKLNQVDKLDELIDEIHRHKETTSNQTEVNDIDRLLKLLNRYKTIPKVSPEGLNRNSRDSIQKEVSLIVNCKQQEIQFKSLMFNDLHKRVISQTSELLDSFSFNTFNSDVPLGAVHKTALHQTSNDRIIDQSDDNYTTESNQLIKKFINSGVKSLEHNYLKNIEVSLRAKKIISRYKDNQKSLNDNVKSLENNVESLKEKLIESNDRNKLLNKTMKTNGETVAKSTQMMAGVKNEVEKADAELKEDVRLFDKKIITQRK